MKHCLDSAFPPSPGVIAAAKAGGVDGWFGYWSSAPYDGGSHFGLYHPWPEVAIGWVQALMPWPIMFVSAGDDPAKVKAASLRLHFIPVVDRESGIPDAVNEQAFIDASGSGIYGNQPKLGVNARCHILAAYIGDTTDATWWGRTPRPAGPCGWQKQGTHTEFGVGCDRGVYDDAIFGLFGAAAGSLGVEDMTPVEHDMELVGAFRDLQFQTGSVDPAMTATLSDGKTLVASLIDFGAPTMVDLFNSQSGPASFPLLKTGRIDKKLDDLLTLAKVAGGADPADVVRTQMTSFVIPMLQTLTDLENKLATAVAAITTIGGGGLTAAQAQELTDTHTAAQAAADEFKKHFTP